MIKVRTLLAAAGWMVLGAIGAALSIYVLTARSKPELASWHRTELGLEATRAAIAEWSFEDYLENEEALFGRLEGLPPMSEAGSLERFNAESPTNPTRFEPNYNRTYEVRAETPIGGALLLHGLSDSPYSLRAIAEALAGRGYSCLALRLPGHGTLPGELRHVSWRDWTAAVGLAARSITEGLESGQPFVVVGYSNGAALALRHSLEAIADDSIRVPDRLIFLSPGLAVSRVAALARWQDGASWLPGLEKLAWNSVVPEVDPYKYNSFAVNAAEQIYKLTSRVEKRLARLEAEGETASLPPVLTIQSVVDSTIPPLTSLSRLYYRLPSNGSELVLFDVNRVAEAQDLLKPGVDDLLRAVQPGQTHAFSMTLVTNLDSGSPAVVAKTRHAGTVEVESEPLDMSWPAGVYSLSHVAIPFRPDDPIYGSEPGAFPFPFGRFEPRGERGALQLPMTLLMRLRHNPFFPYVERRIVEFVD